MSGPDGTTSPRFPDPDSHEDRRTFLRLMGASLALAGASACTRQPAETIVPYVRQPEEIVPGRALFYATAMPLGGSALGLLVESHEGRPTKIEGNPLHPGSLGAADRFAQAAILSLYDPDRSQTPTENGDIRPWSAFLGAIRSVLNAQQPLRGRGLRLLTESINSPTLAAQIRDLLARFPEARWHQWDPVSRENARAGSRLAFGQYVDTQYRLERADVIVSLDAEFLGVGPGGVRYAHDFAMRRRPGATGGMSRFYAIESMPTSSGAKADHRLPLRPGDIVRISQQLAAAVGIANVPVPASLTASSGADLAKRFVDAIAKDLRAHQGSGLVIAGEGQPPLVHALAHAMNAALNNVGAAVMYTEPVEANPIDQLQSMQDLTNDMNAGMVDALVIVGGNPVYSAPPDLKLADAMDRVMFRAHLSPHEDETSALCHWHIPEAHFLEAWSDARAYDGTASIVQPLIAPLYGGKSAHEVLAAMSDRPDRSAHDIVREQWRSNGADQDAAWRRWLHDGVIPNTAYPAKPVAVQPRAFAGAAERTVPMPNSLEITFRNDPTVLDGRFANNGWLQELPKPLTSLTWDNAVIVSPATAARLKFGGYPAFAGGEHGQIVSDVVELRRAGRSIRGPLLAVVGHADDCVTVHLGYGRTRAGQLGTGPGFDANAIRSIDALWLASDGELSGTGERASLACTQYHHQMEGRGAVRTVTLDEFVRTPEIVREHDETPARIITLHPNVPYDGYKWGMAIDINACVGCNACIVACQSENNIPIVGKPQVLLGREMHWLRVDSYYEGPADHPDTYFQPVPCMHCENAPCEVVCPVGATVHSDEGLNDMVYNRCVGTRYCSNNCPYKVRRFNFLLYQDWNTPSLKLGRNPDVTVRSRGVMEKCTYCVQRINAAKIESETHDRTVSDGDIRTACQQTCPADAIVFGNLNDPNSRVSRLQADARNYSLLGELNTRPRTTYLAAVRNTSSDLG